MFGLVVALEERLWIHYDQVTKTGIFFCDYAHVQHRLEFGKIGLMVVLEESSKNQYSSSSLKQKCVISVRIIGLDNSVYL